jgi:TonB family protein
VTITQRDGKIAAFGPYPAAATDQLATLNGSLDMTALKIPDDAADRWAALAHPETVRARRCVDTNGKVVRATIERSSGVPGYDAAFLEFVKRARGPRPPAAIVLGERRRSIPTRRPGRRSRRRARRG